MIKKNDIYDAIICDITAEGNGVAKIDGYTLFVPMAAVGDEVILKVLKTGKSFGYAKILEVVHPAETRTNPPCENFKRCGGCALMHLSYKEQLRIKRKSVEDAMTRIGGFKDIKVADIEPCAKELRYRNKIQIPVTNDDGKARAGFFAARSHRAVPVADCLLQSKANKKIIDAVLCWMEKYKITAYSETEKKGIVRHIYIREGFESGEIMVSLIVNAENLPHKEELVAELIKIKGITSVMLNINTKDTNVILGEKTQVLYGKDYIYDTLDGIKFKISHNSFFQVNPAMTVKLYKKAVELLGDVEDKTVFDLYCGIGTISSFVAKKAKKVIGIEYVPEAVEDAKENAKINNLSNTEFYAGDAAQVFDILYKEGYSADAAVIDPPRKGCDVHLIETLLKMNPEKIIYVSCNPATLARDLKIFCEKGYVPSEVYPFDCFAQTGHVECVVRLCREAK